MARSLLTLLVICAISLSSYAQTPGTSYQGIWWAAPAGSESGWGINLTHQGDVLFATWFTYDNAGRGLWLVASLVRDADGTYSGDFYRTRGPAYTEAAFDPARVTASRIGSGSVTFSSTTSATFSYDINGIRNTKNITPQIFRWAPTCTLGAASLLDTTINRSGLWWASPAASESGWGLNLVHQGNSIFLTWFTYDTDSEPLWLVATLEPRGNMWTGSLYRATGPALGGAFNPSAVSMTPVGGATLEFGYEAGLANDNLADFSYGVGSLSGRKRLTRQLFRDTPTTCDVSYPEQFVRDAMRAANVSGLASGIIFANEFKLSAFQLGYLLGTDPLAVLRFMRQNPGAPLAGGAKLEGYSLSFENAIQVPADVSQQRYPTDYTVPARTVTVSDPYCDPAPSHITYPSAYLGTQPLPSINRPATLPQFRRIGWFKDVWAKPTPNFVPGCRGDTREAFKRTLARMKQLSIDTVVLTPWTIFDRSPPAWRVVNPGLLNTSTMNDTDLEWAVGEAKRQGLSVIWRSQIQGAPAGLNDYSFPEASSANVLASFDALEPYLEERGAFLQRIGVDAVSLPYGYWTDFEAIVGAATYTNRTRRLVESLRRTFRGQVWFDWGGIAWSGATADMFDGHVAWVAGNIPPGTQSFSVIRSAYVTTVELVRRTAGSKPIMWYVNAFSRQDAFEPGFVEETFCTPGTSGGTATDCVQETKVTNFGLQATAVEAALEAVFAADSSPHGVAVPLWMDDNVMPSATFPNISDSIRGKPAESIVYRWFIR